MRSFKLLLLFIAFLHTPQLHATQDLPGVVISDSRPPEAPPTAHSITYDEHDFKRSGAATIGEFLKTLAFNRAFSNPAGVFDSDQPLPPGIVESTTGEDSVLILVDGRRVAPRGSFISANVSALPLGAVEEIVVTRYGASGIYGPDATGGVLNFRLRKDYRAAQTDLRSSASAGGGAEQFGLSQLYGRSWAHGNLVGTGGCQFSESLRATERIFSQHALGTTLVPENDSCAASFSIKHEIWGTEFRANGWYAGNVLGYTTPLGPGLPAVDFGFRTRQANVELGVRWTANDWTVDTSLSWSRSDLQFEMNLPNASEPFTDARTDETSWSADVQVNHDFDIDGRLVSFRFGGSAQHFQPTLVSGMNPFDVEAFESGAAFLSLKVPLTRHIDVTLVERLELLAGFDDPHGRSLELAFAPNERMRFSALWSGAPRAPSYQHLFTGNIASSILRDDRGALVAVVHGNNPDLTAERADTIVIGSKMIFPKGVRAELNLYEVRHRQRISRLGVPLGTLRTDSAYRSLVTLPEDGESFHDAWASWMDGHVPIVGCTALDPTTGACLDSPDSVQAIIDNRLQNIAASTVRGIDLRARAEREIGNRSVTGFVDATHVMDYERKATPLSPTQDLVDTFQFPPDLRMRLGGSIAWNSWYLAGVVQYTDSYDGPVPGTNVGSWVTCDITGSYALKRYAAAISLNIRNAFDEDPPYVAAAPGGLDLAVGFDRANADPLGRTYSIQITMVR